MTGKLDIASVVSQFSKEIFTDMISDHVGSIVISPLFIQSALVVLLMGATGNTEKILKDRLGLGGLPRTAIANQFHSLLEPLQNSSTLKLANAIFVPFNYKINSLYRTFAAEQFYSSILNADFVDSSSRAALLINNWVSNATDGHIYSFIKPFIIQPTTAIIMANAIYFHGLWQHEFASESIRPITFYTNGQCISTKSTTIASVFDTV